MSFGIRCISTNRPRNHYCLIFPEKHFHEFSSLIGCFSEESFSFQILSGKIRSIEPFGRGIPGKGIFSVDLEADKISCEKQRCARVFNSSF